MMFRYLASKIKAQINLSQLGIITAQNNDNNHYIHNTSGQLKPFALSLHPVISNTKHQIQANVYQSLSQEEHSECQTTFNVPTFLFSTLIYFEILDVTLSFWC